MSESRRSLRAYNTNLSGPDEMYKKLGRSFVAFVLDENCPHDYQALVNHYSSLWQEYANRKNKKRRKKKIHDVDPRYFFRMNEALEKESNDTTILTLIRKNCCHLTNNVEIIEVIDEGGSPAGSS